MALEAISKLFATRDIRIDADDVQFGIERYLQQELHTENVHCRVRGTSLRVDIRVGTTALAEAVLIREKDIREYVKTQLQCSLAGIFVILDV